VAERADLGAEREALLAVEIPERPGSFLQFCETLGQRSITEFNYRYHGSERAHVFVGFALGHGHEEAHAVIAQLRGAGYQVIDMSGNEMAKLHVRYMIGGHAPLIEARRIEAPGIDAAVDELLYRFEFPERPGALLRFLKSIGTSWNISLFHYRNHGSDYGRVLAGIQVPKAERADFLQHLLDLHYAYLDETANPAYRMFLGS
jgi:threonine dehydratase